MGRPRFTIALLFAAASIITRSALAEDRRATTCAMVVDADSGIRAQWPELPAAIRDAFESRSDIDPCAQVKLTLSPQRAIGTQVVLADGRSTSRTVARRDDVMPVLEGLLLLPRRPAVVAASAPNVVEPLPVETTSTIAPPPPFVTPEWRDMPSATPRATKSSSSSSPSDHLRIELSALMAVRAGDGQGGGGVAAASFLHTGGWLAGFAGRLDLYQDFDSGREPGGALTLALLGGRRIALGSGSVSLDLIGGPAAALQGTATSTRQETPTAQPVTESSSSTVPRLLLGSRLNFGARSRLRTFIGVDGEVGPGRADGAELPRDAHRLPAWALGFALGATVGTL